MERTPKLIYLDSRDDCFPPRQVTQTVKDHPVLADNSRQNGCYLTMLFYHFGVFLKAAAMCTIQDRNTVFRDLLKVTPFWTLFLQVDWYKNESDFCWSTKSIQLLLHLVVEDRSWNWKTPSKTFHIMLWLYRNLKIWPLALLKHINPLVNCTHGGFTNLIALKNPNTQKLLIVVLKPAFSGGIVVAFFGFWAKLPAFEMSDKESVEY